jgi:hypothetical protein
VIERLVKIEEDLHELLRRSAADSIETVEILPSLPIESLEQLRSLNEVILDNEKFNVLVNFFLKI